MKEPSERITKAKRLHMLAHGYKALKRNKAGAYQAAAEALERSNKDEAPKVREPQLVSE